MKHPLLLIGLAFSTAAAAQHSHGGMEPSLRADPNRAQRRGSAEQPLLFDGEVRAVDKQSGNVTLTHGPISIFDMPAATTAYPVKDASMLDTLEVGSKVRFTAVLQARVFVITQIVPVK